MSNKRERCSLQGTWGFHCYSLTQSGMTSGLWQLMQTLGRYSGDTDFKTFSIIAYLWVTICAASCSTCLQFVPPVQIRSGELDSVSRGVNVSAVVSLFPETRLFPPFPVHAGIYPEMEAGSVENGFSVSFLILLLEPFNNAKHAWCPRKKIWSYKGSIPSVLGEATINTITGNGGAASQVKIYSKNRSWMIFTPETK